MIDGERESVHTSLPSSALSCSSSKRYFPWWLEKNALVNTKVASFCSSFITTSQKQKNMNIKELFVGAFPMQIVSQLVNKSDAKNWPYLVPV